MLKWSPSHRKRTEVGASQSYSDVVQLRLGHTTAAADVTSPNHLALPGASAPFTASLDRRKMVYRGRQPPQRSRSASGTKIETSADATCERAKDGRPSAMTMRHRSVHLGCLLPRHMQKRDRHSIDPSAVRPSIRPSVDQCERRGEIRDNDSFFYDRCRRPRDVDDPRRPEEQGARGSRQEAPHQDAQPALRGHIPPTGE